MAEEYDVLKDGTKVLKPQNTLAEYLAETEVERDAASAQLTENLLQAVEDKRDRQQTGDVVPDDKSPL